MKRKLSAVLLVLGVAIGLSVGGAAPALAAGATGAPVRTVTTDVEDFTFASYDADYWLTRDAEGTSQLRTVETLVAEFPDFDQNRGIIRAIPDEYNGIPLQTSIESVVDENGDPVYYETAYTDGFAELSLGTDEYLRGDHTFTISYTQTDVVRAFEDTNAQELYWDTNGTGFAQPFGILTARFHIAADLVDSLTGNAACYLGSEGSGESCELIRTGDDAGEVFSAEATDLGPGENLTVAIGFESGTFTVPAPPTPSTWAYLVPIGLMILAGLLTLVGVFLRLRAPGDAKGRGTIIPQYSLPENLNLFEAGNLVGQTKESIPATLVSLAVRGNLQIVDGGKKDFSLRYLSEDGTDVQEGQLLAAVFGGKRKPGTVRSLKKVDPKRATKMQKVLADTKNGVLARGLRKQLAVPGGVALFITQIVLFVAAIGVCIAAAILSPVMTVSAIVVVVVATVGALLTAFCVFRGPVLTDTGVELRDYVEGMRVYLKLAEEDRFRMLQSPDGALRVDVADQTQVVKLYEKLLPYAVLWGIEEEWSEELAVRYQDTQPEWFIGSGGFNPVLFGAAMHSFSSTTVSAATPTYSGSGGGSFSGGSMGGGFSGGGGGGGGGGGR